MESKKPWGAAQKKLFASFSPSETIHHTLPHKSDEPTDKIDAWNSRDEPTDKTDAWDSREEIASVALERREQEDRTTKAG